MPGKATGLFRSASPQPLCPRFDSAPVRRGGTSSFSGRRGGQHVSLTPAPKASGWQPLVGDSEKPEVCPGDRVEEIAHVTPTGQKAGKESVVTCRSQEHCSVGAARGGLGGKPGCTSGRRWRGNRDRGVQVSEHSFWWGSGGCREAARQGLGAQIEDTPPHASPDTQLCSCPARQSRAPAEQRPESELSGPGVAAPQQMEGRVCAPPMPQHQL